MATNPLLDMQKPEDDGYNMALQRLMSTLDSRQNRGYNPNLLAIAEGMLTPTATGSFGEGIGQAAKAVRGVQEQEARREQDNAMMRFQLAKENMGVQEKRQKQNLMGELYQETPTGTTFNPKAARELARVTGDPKFLEQILANEQQLKIKQAEDKIFIPETIEKNGVKETKYEFDTKAALESAKLSNNFVDSVAKYMETASKWRRLGLLKSGGTENTPFDIIYLTSDSPLIKSSAASYAKQFREGTLDQQEAEKIAERLGKRVEDLEYKNNQQKYNEMMRGAILGLRRDQISFDQSMKTEKLQDKKQSETDTKIKAATDVDELLTSMKASYDNLKELGSMKSTSEGMLGNLAASAKTSGLGQAIGRSFGTKTQSEINDIETMKPLLLQSIKNATGMSSAQMNSNAELKFYLNAATDPTKGYEENIKAIQRLQKMYGLSSLPKRIKPSDQPELSSDQNKKPPSDQPVLRWNPVTKSFE